MPALPGRVQKISEEKGWVKRTTGGRLLLRDLAVGYQVIPDPQKPHVLGAGFQYRFVGLSAGFRGRIAFELLRLRKREVISELRLLDALPPQNLQFLYGCRIVH